MPIPKGYVRADTDGELYKREDTEWLVEPTYEDVGVVGPKAGAVCKADAEANKVCRVCEGDVQDLETGVVCGHCNGTGEEPVET